MSVYQIESICEVFDGVLRLTIFDSGSLSLVEANCPRGGVESGARWRVLAILKSIDQVDGFTEIATLDGHDHVDGVEVLLATETPSQVVLGIGGGVELRAQGTQEAEVALRDLAGKTKEIGDEACNRDVVSKHPELFLGIA